MNEIEENRKRLAKALIVAMYNAGVFVPLDQALLVELTALADDILQTHEWFVQFKQIENSLHAIDN